MPGIAAQDIVAMPDSTRLAAVILGACLAVCSRFGAASPAPLPAPDLRLIAQGEVVAVARLIDGSVVFGGTFQSVNGERRRALAKIRADGTLDPDFRPEILASVTALAADASGHVYVAGTFTSIGGVARRYLAKLDGTDGTVDPDWNPAPDSYPGALAVDASGNVFAAGGFTEIGGRMRNRLAKLAGNGTGAADASWNPNPVGSTSGSTDVRAIAASGAHLYVAGSFTSIGGRTRAALAKLDTGGTGLADASWYPQPSRPGFVAYSVASVAADAAGDVYIAGGFDAVNGLTRHGIAKLAGAGNGAPVAAWDAGIPCPIINCTGAGQVVAGADGAIYAIGNFSQAGGQPRRYLARLSASTGAADPGWDAQVADAGGAYPVVALTAAADGTVYAAGRFHAIGGEGRLGFAVLGPGGAAQAVADAEATGYPNAIVAQPDGGMIVAGEFAKAGGQSRPHILRLRADGTLDPSWNPGLDATANALAIDSAGNVYVGGKFERAGGLARMHLARIDAAGVVDAAWNPTAPDAPSNLVAINALAIDSVDSLYVGGYFNRFGGQVRGGLAKVDSAGNVDAGWNPGVADQYPTIYTLAVDGNRVFAGGVFNQLGGMLRHNLAKLVAIGSGEADALWNPAPDNYIVRAVFADHAGSLYVHGAFAQIGGQARNGVAKIGTEGTGAADPAWNPAIAQSVVALGFDGSHVYANFLQSSTAWPLRRYEAGNAAVDACWSPLLDDGAYAIARRPDGSLLVGGRFTRADGMTRGGLAAFPAQCAAATDSIFRDGFEDADRLFADGFDA